MTVVVDTSVWISVLRNVDRAAVRALHALDDEIVLGDLVLLEILQGARDHAHAVELEHELSLLTIVPMVGEIVARRAAANFRHLRERGITIRKTVDLMIGAYCIINDYRLLHDDRDFEPMAKYLGLKIVEHSAS